MSSAGRIEKLNNQFFISAGIWLRNMLNNNITRRSDIEETINIRTNNVKVKDNIVGAKPTGAQVFIKACINLDVTFYEIQNF